MSKWVGLSLIMAGILFSQNVHNIWTKSARIGPNGLDMPSQNSSVTSSFPQSAKQREGYLVKSIVDMVVLHASVFDEKDRTILDLKQDDFRIMEDQEEQKIATFALEDIPVSIGLVIDNSASMITKRPRVNAAAIKFVRTSNPHDEIFVVNFSDVYHLDQEFTNDRKLLYKSIRRIDSRGGTSLYDSVIDSLHHVSKGTCKKKVLLLVTDGEDNGSLKDLGYTIQIAKHSNADIYAIGLFDDDSQGEKSRAAQSLQLLAKATGGEAFFPKRIAEIRDLCKRIAGEIRSQYTLSYYPNNRKHDGAFRTVQVLVGDINSRRLFVRARPGYYARDTTASQ